MASRISVRNSRHLIFAWPRVIPTSICIVNMDDVGSPAILPLEFSDVPAAAWRSLPTELVTAMPDIVKPSSKIIFGHHPTLVDRPGVGGHWLAMNVTSFRGKLTAGYQLDATPRREILDPAVMSSLRVQGDFGLVSQLGESDAEFADIREGKVFVGQTDIGVPAPEGTKNSQGLWRMVAHDGHTTVMYRAKDPDASSVGNGVARLYVRSGPAGVWKTFQVPGSKPRIKMIDSWVIGAAASDALGRESPGATERRRYQERYTEERARNHRREGRIATDSVLDWEKVYLPGVLFLIDSGTGRYFEIRTGQGDSEILLVHDDTVYYRINDSIFAAPLQKDSVGPGRVLVRDDFIPDVHWAFWGS